MHPRSSVAVHAYIYVHVYFSIRRQCVHLFQVEDQEYISNKHDKDFVHLLILSWTICMLQETINATTEEYSSYRTRAK